MKNRFILFLVIGFFAMLWSKSNGQEPGSPAWLMQQNNAYYNQQMQNYQQMQQNMQNTQPNPSLMPQFEFIYNPGSTPTPYVAPSYTLTPTPQSSNSSNNTPGNHEHSHHRCYFTGTNDIRHCGGDGRCSLCGGDGLMDSFGLNNAQCSLCKGSGKCVTCHGTGWID